MKVGEIVGAQYHRCLGQVGQVCVANIRSDRITGSCSGDVPREPARRAQIIFSAIGHPFPLDIWKSPR